MGKKKFIEKGEATHFQLVHRSQQDKAAEGDDDASAFVLVPAGASRAAVRRNRERLQKRGEVRLNMICGIAA
jgi:protein LTV1